MNAIVIRISLFVILMLLAYGCLNENMLIEIIDLDSNDDALYANQSHFLVHNYSKDDEINLDSFALHTVCSMRDSLMIAQLGYSFVFYKKTRKTTKEYLEDRPKAIFHNPDESDRISKYYFSNKRPGILNVKIGNVYYRDHPDKQLKINCPR